MLVHVLVHIHARHSSGNKSAVTRFTAHWRRCFLWQRVTTDEGNCGAAEGSLKRSCSMSTSIVSKANLSFTLRSRVILKFSLYKRPLFHKWVVKAEEIYYTASKWKIGKKSLHFTTMVSFVEFFLWNIKDYYDLEYWNIPYLSYSICHNLVYILAFIHNKAIMPSWQMTKKGIILLLFEDLFDGILPPV